MAIFDKAQNDPIKSAASKYTQVRKCKLIDHGQQLQHLYSNTYYLLLIFLGEEQRFLKLPLFSKWSAHTHIHHYRVWSIFSENLAHKNLAKVIIAAQSSLFIQVATCFKTTPQSLQSCTLCTALINISCAISRNFAWAITSLFIRSAITVREKKTQSLRCLMPAHSSD